MLPSNKQQANNRLGELIKKPGADVDSRSEAIRYYLGLGSLLSADVAFNHSQNKKFITPVIGASSVQDEPTEQKSVFALIKSIILEQNAAGVEIEFLDAD